MKTASLKSNFVFNLLYQLLTILTPLITTPYVSRVLAADGVGIYSYVLANATYFCIFGTLGITTYGQLEIARVRDDKNKLWSLIQEVLITRTITMCSSIILYIILVFFIKNYKMMYLVMLLCLLGQVNDMSFIYQGLEQFKVLAIRNMLVKMVGVILIFICVGAREDLYIYAVILQGSNLISNFFLWPSVMSNLKKHKIEEFQFITLVKHLKNSFTYFIPTVATMIYTVMDKSMIGWLTGSSIQNGFYEQVHKIEQILVTVVVSIGVVTLPRMAYYYKNKDQSKINHIMNFTMRFILFTSVPMCLGLLYCANYLVPIFLGEGFHESVILLQIFSVLIVVVGLDNIVGKQCLVAAGEQKKYNIGVISGAIINFILNIILIPSLKATGAAIASVSAEVVILMIFLAFGRLQIDIKQLALWFVKYLMISCIMGIFVWTVGKIWELSIQTLCFQVVTGVISYAGILIMIKDEMILYIIKSVVKK